jgi:hypothetical protein
MKRMLKLIKIRKRKKTPGKTSQKSLDVVVRTFMHYDYKVDTNVKGKMSHGYGNVDTFQTLRLARRIRTFVFC